MFELHDSKEQGPQNQPEVPDTLTSPIVLAINDGDLSFIASLINRKPEFFQSRYGEAGSTPLHLAALAGRSKIVEFFLSKGANVNVRDKDGMTPLHNACFLYYVEIAKLLLDHNADPNASTYKKVETANFGLAIGSDPLEDFIRRGEFPKTTTCTYTTGLYRPIHFAARKNAAELIEALLEKEAEIDPKDSQFWTPLFYAAQNGDFSSTSSLLKHNANPNARDLLGRTPLFGAVISEDIATCRLIKHQGGDPHAEDKNEISPVSLAIDMNLENILQALAA